MTKKKEKESSLGMGLPRPDGRVYDGEWLNGKQHGIGFFTNPGANAKQGEWRDGKRVRWINVNQSDISQKKSDDKPEFQSTNYNADS